MTPVILGTTDSVLPHKGHFELIWDPSYELHDCDRKMLLIQNMGDMQDLENEETSAFKRPFKIKIWELDRITGLVVDASGAVITNTTDAADVGVVLAHDYVGRNAITGPEFVLVPQKWRNELSSAVEFSDVEETDKDEENGEKLCTDL